MEETIVARIEVKSKILLVVYNKFLWGLFRKLHSDKEIYDYIQEDSNIAYREVIQKDKNGYYILNIASVDDFCAFEVVPESLLEEQLRIYSPIIQAFIVDAHIGKLA